MTKSIKTNWWLLLLAGIIFLILAVKVMMHPAGSIIGLAFFIGWASLIAGVFPFPLITVCIDGKVSVCLYPGKPETG